ncbi:MAG TPA: RNA polymerase factor sigma-54 [Hyphomicrobiaceae bacterium]|nr:RNA polymerase factor sigma-54 [Hyphomicrobiaceae bacterium]
MALTTKLELRQSQQLVMTPQLQQAIRLLQFSNLELSQFVETELERNPLLERAEQGEDAPQDEAGEATQRADADRFDTAETNRASENGSNGADPTDTVSDGENSGERNGAEAGSDEAWLDMAKTSPDPEQAFDTEYDNVYPDTVGSDLGNWSSVRTRDHGFGDEESNLESYVSAELSLKDHLSAQLPLVLHTPAERLVGQYMVDLVDESGYISSDLDHLAERLGASEAMVASTLAKLQTLDPAGVFARSLGECLALQLKEQNRYDPVIAALLDNLHLLAKRDLAALRRAVNVDMDELTEMIQEIKGLNPKPGLGFGSVQVQPVVPDVFVRPAQDGSWLVELNSETLPRVLINRSYYTRVSTKTASDKDKGYLLECLQTANWLVKSLDQRARTILRVAEEIVRQQDGFFTHGVQYLRPLNLKTVADAIQMHESTVSRVTSNKYLSSPRGIFELKYFFTSAIANSDEGEAHSSEAVRFRIKQLIDAETARSILSDDKIVERLKNDGIDIARRTVAKYREAMRIPSSVQRRRDKEMHERLGRV